MVTETQKVLKNSQAMSKEGMPNGPGIDKPNDI